MVPHHLIDILDPTEHYSAGRFVEDAYKLIQDIHKRGKIPLLVGGTMLYFKVLTSGLALLPARDQEVRLQIEREAMAKGWPALHQKLSSIDKDAAAKIQPEDRQRIERALEVYYLTHMPISKLQAENLKTDLAVLALALQPQDRSRLHAAIAKRCQLMLEQGLIAEVKHLQQRGDLSLAHASMRAVGYRQVWEFLEGQFSKAELAAKIMAATRQYAKRQLTWLRTFPNVEYFDNEAGDLLTEVYARITRFIAY